jgi:hypothetical protein
MALGIFRAVVFWVVGSLGVASQALAQANTVGLITVADGPVEVVRGGARFDAREGTPLQAQDIVRTLAGTRLARLETTQGAAIDLGPATQLLLHPATSPWPGERSALAYLATGWAKFSQVAQTAPNSAPNTAPIGLATASVHVAPSAAGVALVQAQGNTPAASATNLFVFVEAGSAQLSEYAAVATSKKWVAAKAVPVAMNEGQAYRRSSSQNAGNLPGDLLARASAAALAEVPPALRDSLPRRATRFAGAAAPRVVYMPLQSADLAVWAQVAEPLRTHLSRRFALPVPVQATEAQTAQGSVASMGAPAVKPTVAPPVRKLAVATSRAKPKRVATLSPRSRQPVATITRIATTNAMPSSAADQGVAMLFERDASAPASLNAVKPGEATARSALPETNTRITETTVTAPALPALAAPIVVSAPPPTSTTPPTANTPRGRTAATGSPR